MSAPPVRRQAWVLLALLAGGVTLARAVRDEAVADEIANAVREEALKFGGKKKCHRSQS